MFPTRSLEQQGLKYSRLLAKRQQIQKISEKQIRPVDPATPGQLISTNTSISQPILGPDYLPGVGLGFDEGRYIWLLHHVVQKIGGCTDLCVLTRNTVLLQQQFHLLQQTHRNHYIVNRKITCKMGIYLMDWHIFMFKSGSHSFSLKFLLSSYITIATMSWPQIFIRIE